MKARKLILTVGAIAAFAAPSALAGVSDATTIVRYLSPQAGTYQLEVENTSGIGYINSFTWASPGKLQITTLTHTVGGSCQLVSNTIVCTGAKQGIAPPSCSCHAGGRMTVDFTATGNAPQFTGRYWIYYGLESDTVITSMTPTHIAIPSFVTGQADLPLCDPGTQPTVAHPCYVE